MLQEIVQKVKEEMCVVDCTKSKGRNVGGDCTKRNGRNCVVDCTKIKEEMCSRLYKK